MDDLERNVKSIRDLEDKAREAAMAKDLDRYVSPDFSLSFKTTRVEVSPAGDFAYTWRRSKKAGGGC